MSKKILFLGLVCALVILGGCQQKTANQNQVQNQEPDQAQIANPASVNCGEQGGELKTVDKIVNGKNYGQYGICYFDDNRQCEEWALFHGYCPLGGIKITGYDNEAQIYCAIIGGEVDMQNKLCKFNNNAECDLDDLYIGNCHQHFNEPATGWEYTKYPEAKILIGHPSTNIYLTDQTPTGDQDVKLTVTVQKINDIPETAPLNYNRTTAQTDQAALAQGEYGTKNIDFALPESEKIIQLTNGIYAKEFVVFSRFDVCDVIFDRIVIFYHNDYQVILKLTGDADKIIQTNSDYFGQNQANCGEDLIWNLSKNENVQKEFYQILTTNMSALGSDTISWFQTFDMLTDAVVIQD